MTAAAVAAMLGVIVAAGGCGGGQGQTAAVPAAAAEEVYVPEPVSLAERESFTGSAECLKCHGEYAEQLESHHARTLETATAATDGERFRMGAALWDQDRAVSYSTGVSGEACVLEARHGSDKARVTAEHAFGSGNRGRTYVGTYNGLPVEMRLSYYRRIGERGRWDFTLGQEAGSPIETPVGRILRPKDHSDCYLCHTTALVQTETGGLDLDRSIHGIGCETCHGPGRKHVEAVERGDKNHLMTRLAEHREEVATKLCGKCHRFPEGDEANNPVVRTQLPRFQGLALSLSKCYQKSGGRLTCVTCHDPHRNADKITRVEYNKSCVSCHTPGNTTHVVCPKKPAGDCVSCHMPVQPVMMPTKPTFHTHFIKVWKEGESPAGADAPKARPLRQPPPAE